MARAVFVFSLGSHQPTLFLYPFWLYAQSSSPAVYKDQVVLGMKPGTVVCPQPTDTFLQPYRLVPEPTQLLWFKATDTDIGPVPWNSDLLNIQTYLTQRYPLDSGGYAPLFLKMVLVALMAVKQSAFSSFSLTLLFLKIFQTSRVFHCPFHTESFFIFWFLYAGSTSQN